MSLPVQGYSTLYPWNGQLCLACKEFWLLTWISVYVLLPGIPPPGNRVQDRISSVFYISRGNGWL